MDREIVKSLIFFLALCQSTMGRETLPGLEVGEIPQSYDALWKDFDPREEPLEVEVLKAWEEEGIAMQVIRYRIGIFKGQKAMMAAIYGYPRGGARLPGLVQIHGGGQYADYRAVLTNGKRGYATISIAWAGRIKAPGYEVNPNGVKLFFANAKNDPDYKLTTDWGALDGYHAPSRNPGNEFAFVKPAAWTLDTVDSPRNNPWFLCSLAARRALTFLERRTEVDPEKLGVYGHSMGGKLTVLTATDPRVKAAAPSCGGISNNDDAIPLYAKTLADKVYLKRIVCPIIFLSPSNDFHGKLKDLPQAIEHIRTKEWRVVSSPHHNHQDSGDFEVTGLLWFDQYLKGDFVYPRTPESSLRLNTSSGAPTFSVKPYQAKPVLEVDIYYTQQGENFTNLSDRENRINRFWHYASAEKKGDRWSASLPLASVDRPLWVYANVRYALGKPVTGAGYYYRVYTTDTFNLSTLVHRVESSQLKAAGLKASLIPSLLIETFADGWEKEWFTYKEEGWGRRTHKVFCDLWKAPQYASLVLDIRSRDPNSMVVGIDKYVSEVRLKGGAEWETVALLPGDFENQDGERLANWSQVGELSFDAQQTLKKRVDDEVVSKTFGGEWSGPDPEFRNLRWVNEH